MSGWLAVWTANDEVMDEKLWQKSAQLNDEESLNLCKYSAGRVRIKAWRREAGEFPASGKMTEVAEGVRVAWVGQALGEGGDVSVDTQKLIARGEVSDGELAAINGPFAAVVCDEQGRRLLVVTDRHRHYPVYCYRKQGLFVASTRYQAVLPWVDEPAVDERSLSLMLRCGECLDGMTMLRDIEMLPGGSVVEVCDDGVKVRRYWQMHHEPDYDMPRSEIIERYAKLLKQSVDRIQAANAKLAVPLSGGLDSRFILGLCDGVDKIHSFTWGEPGCRDVKCAIDIAKRVGSPHHVEHWQPKLFVNLWDKGVELTAGCFGVRDMYVFPYASLLGEYADVTLNGFAGDALLGGSFVMGPWLKIRDMETLARDTWRWRVSESEDWWVDQLLCGSGCEGQEIWLQSLMTKDEGRPIDRLNNWLYQNRVARYTSCGTMLLRSRVESHAPFYDNDLIDLMLRIPLELKYKHRLYLDVLNKGCPTAAAAPWQRTGIAPGYGYWANFGALVFHRLARIMAGRLGIDPFPSMKVADTAGWFRNEWKQPAADIVLSDKALSRGYVNADAVRKVWDAHQAGADLSRLLGVLVSLELFFEQTFDRK